MIDAFRSRQFLIFLLTGGVAACVNFGARIVLNRWMGFSAAIVVAYLLGMVTAFVLARTFVFGGGQLALHRSAVYFVLVNAVAVLQTWAASLLLALYVLPALGVDRFAAEIAHGIGVIVPVFTSYLGHKHLSFR
ncbi:MAG: GtrA family protein [Mitsuaria chitosanitabida]|uniref:GtrA family protein n=1 Tax=Roseateles chitosanitabidus TaxID=65048 RepID=UPI001B1CCACF|nr:GtrA family protein [Roseateles chitosanitabidus]MBO9688675.1 GtrA family protein [Roseateles chitosanitabidus]